jgi:hypothetical protein
MGHDAYSGGFFAGVQVDKAGDVTAAEVHVQSVFKFADGSHRAVAREQGILA